MSADAAVPATASTADGPVDTGPGGVHVWFAAVGGIGIWMAHLIAVASLARIACTGSGVATWWNYGITAVAAALTLYAMALSEGLRRRGRAGGDGTVSTLGAEGFANLDFIGRFGLFVGACNLLLIVFEGSMAVWLSPCA
jgi:hypothetical protein